MQVECRPVHIPGFSDELSAHAFASCLHEQGISAAVQGGFTANFRGGGPGDVSVLVDARHLDQAHTILALAKEAREARTLDSPRVNTTFNTMRLTWTFLAINIIGLVCYLAYFVITSQH